MEEVIAAGFLADHPMYEKVEKSLIVRVGRGDGRKSKKNVLSNVRKGNTSNDLF